MCRLRVCVVLNKRSFEPFVCLDLIQTGPWAVCLFHPWLNQCWITSFSWGIHTNKCKTKMAIGLDVSINLIMIIIKNCPIFHPTPYGRLVRPETGMQLNILPPPLATEAHLLKYKKISKWPQITANTLPNKLNICSQFCWAKMVSTSLGQPICAPPYLLMLPLK